MDFMVLASRAVHVSFGAFWVCAIFFIVFFLEPSVRSAGPDGNSVMKAMRKRRLMTVMPIVAVFTILSGGFLFWRMLEGFGMQWASTRFGMALSIGAAASLVAFGQGYFFMRRAALRAGALSEKVTGNLEAPNRNGALAEVARLKSRSRIHARWVAGWLTIALITMAVARYL